MKKENLRKIRTILMVLTQFLWLLGSALIGWKVGKEIGVLVGVCIGWTVAKIIGD